jgi:hypothetical protein
MLILSPAYRSQGSGRAQGKGYGHQNKQARLANTHLLSIIDASGLVKLLDVTISQQIPGLLGQPLLDEV